MTVPQTAMTSTVGVSDEAALARLAAMVVAARPPRAFFALHGDLGAGKTTFVKAAAAALGIDPVAVISPTFGLLHMHDGPQARLLHADLYRLADPAELHETGWDDAVAAADVVCVEWPERIATALPVDRVDVTFTIESPTARTLTFVARGPAHVPVIAAVTAHAADDGRT